MAGPAAAIPMLTRVLAGLTRVSSLGGLAESTGAVGAGQGKALDDVLGKVAQVGDKLKQLGGIVTGLGTSAAAVLSPMTYVTAGFKGLSAGLGAALTPVTELTAGMKLAAGVINQVVDAATGLGAAVKPFVDKANPAYSRQFERATTDLVASFGHALIPVMQAATAITRGFADVVYRLSGPMGRLADGFFAPLGALVPRLVDALTPALDVTARLAAQVGATLTPSLGRLGEAVARVAADVAPLGAVLAEAVTPVVAANVAALAGWVTHLAYAAEAATAPLVRLTKALGISGVGAGPGAAGGSMGAGVTAARFGSGQEDLFKQAALSAFMLGAGPKKDDPAEASKGFLELILKFLREEVQPVLNIINKGRDAIASLPDGKSPLWTIPITPLPTLVGGALGRVKATP